MPRISVCACRKPCGASGGRAACMRKGEPGSAGRWRPSPDASPELRALALEGLGNLAWKQGDLLVAAAAYEESLATWQAAGKLARSGVALTALGIIVELRGDIPRAISLQEQAVAIGREVGDPARLAVALNNLGTVMQTAGER